MANSPFNPQSFVQPQAQSNSPFLANNGNPNTAYNQPQQGTVSLIPVTGGYVPPQSDAMNNWAVNQAAAAAAATPFWQTPSTLPVAGPRVTVPPLITDPTWVPTPVVPPTVTPPTVTPPVTTTTPPVTTTVTPPSTNPTTNGVNNTGNGYRGELYNGLGGVPAGPNWDANFSATRNPDGSVGQSPAAGNFLSLLGNSTGLRNPDGTMDWAQFADAATEVLFPGDIWNENLNKVNWTTALTSTLNAVAPGLGSIVDKLADTIPDTWGGFMGWIRDFFQRGDIASALDQILKNTNANDINGGNTNINPYTGLPNSNEGLIDWSTINSWGGGYTGNPTVSVGDVQDITNQPQTTIDMTLNNGMTVPATAPNPFVNPATIPVPSIVNQVRSDNVLNTIDGGVFGMQGMGGGGAMEILGSRMRTGGTSQFNNNTRAK